MVIFHKNKRIVAIVFGIFLALLQQTTYALDANANAKDVADKLNALYQHTEVCSNDEPAYYCSGIIVHGQKIPAKDGDDKPALSWYLPTYRNIGSFSYLRKDITPHVGNPIWLNTGYILTPADNLEANKEFKYTVYCAYPGDGGTFDGLETSCVYRRTAMMGEEVSSDQIHVVADYITKYLDNSFTKWRPSMGLGFHTTKSEFDLAMQIYQYIYKDHLDKIDEQLCNKDACSAHNELIISAWEKKDVPDAQVPIIAFFAVINNDQNPRFKASGRTSTSKEEMQQLFADAEAYSKATNYTRRIPVITIDMAKLRKGEPDVFAPAVNPVEKLR